jgi:hypothetical protein
MTDKLWTLFNEMDSTEIALAMRMIVECARDDNAQFETDDVCTTLFAMCNDTSSRFDDDECIFVILGLAIQYPTCRLVFARLGDPMAMQNYLITLQAMFHSYYCLESIEGVGSVSLSEQVALTPAEFGYKARMLYLER